MRTNPTFRQFRAAAILLALVMACSALLPIGPASAQQTTCNGRVATKYVNAWDHGLSFTGGDGVDVIVIAQGARNVTVYGGAGDDLICGNDQENSLYGQEGKDSIWGRGGNDTIDGGPGNDHLDGGYGLDLVKGGAGNDFLIEDRHWSTPPDAEGQLWGGPGSDVIYGGFGGKRRIFGCVDPLLTRTDAVVRAMLQECENDPANDRDWIIGGNGRDIIDGQFGSDYIDGRGGPDLLEGGPGNDMMFGGTGIDELRGGNDNDFMDTQWPTCDDCESASSYHGSDTIADNGTRRPHHPRRPFLPLYGLPFWG